MSLSRPSAARHLSYPAPNLMPGDPRRGIDTTPRNPLADDEQPMQRPSASTLPLPTPSVTMQPSQADHQRLLAPTPPSCDADLIHQRLSDLRTALDTSNRICSNLEIQVDGLKMSLQSKHDESTRLQLDLSKAQGSLELIQASWQGDLTQVQCAMIDELRSEIASRSYLVVKLQSELQSRQFEVQSLISSHTSSMASEAQERARLATELGQARVLAQARARQLESALESSNVLQDKMDQNMASESRRYEAALLEIQSLCSEMKDKEKVWADEQSALQSECEGLRASRDEVQLKAEEFHSKADELKSKALKLEAVIRDQELQVEWLEGALSDLNGSEGYGSSKALRGIDAYESLVREAHAQGCEAQRLKLRVDELVEERMVMMGVIEEQQAALDCIQMRGDQSGEGEEEQLVEEGMLLVKACEDKGTQADDGDVDEVVRPSLSPSWSEALTHDEDNVNQLADVAPELALQPLPCSPPPPPTLAPQSLAVNQAEKLFQLHSLESSQLIQQSQAAAAESALIAKMADESREIRDRYELRIRHMKSLLDAATGEIERLSQLNKKLLDSSSFGSLGGGGGSLGGGSLGGGGGEEGGRKVPLDDVKKALMEVRESCRLRSEEALEACTRSWASRLYESDEKLQASEQQLSDTLSQLSTVTSQKHAALSRISELEASVTRLVSERDEALERAVDIQKISEEDSNSKVMDLEAKIKMLMDQALLQRAAFEFEFKRAVLHAETRHEEILHSSISEVTREANAEIERLQEEIGSLNVSLAAKCSDLSSVMEERLALQMSDSSSAREWEREQVEMEAKMRSLEKEIEASKGDLNQSRDRLASLEIDLSSIQSHNKELEIDLSTIQSHNKELEIDLSTIQSHNKELKQLLLEAERLHADERSAVEAKAAVDSDALRTEIDLLIQSRDEMKASNDSELSSLKSRVVELGVEWANVTDALVTSEAEVERLLSLVGSLGCDLEEGEERLKKSDLALEKSEMDAKEMAQGLQSQLSSTSKELQSCLERISQLESDLQKSEREVQSLVQQSQESSSLANGLSLDLDKSQVMVQELKRQLEERVGECGQMESLVYELEAACEEKEGRLGELEAELVQMRQALHAKCEELVQTRQDLHVKVEELVQTKQALHAKGEELVQTKSGLERRLREAAVVRVSALADATNTHPPSASHPPSINPHRQAMSRPQPARHLQPRPPSPSAKDAVRALEDLEAQLLPVEYLKSISRGIDKDPRHHQQSGKGPTPTARPPLDLSDRNVVSKILHASRNVDLVALASASTDVAMKKRPSLSSGQRLAHPEPGSSYFAALGEEGQRWRMTDTVRGSVGDGHEGEGVSGFGKSKARISLADLSAHSSLKKYYAWEAY